MITGRKQGKCDYYVCPSGYARGTIRWWCNFYLELAADKENPGAEREKIRYLPRWTRGALRIIFTCGHRCFVDGRIRALIKLMQPTSAPRTDRTLPLHGLSRHGLSMRVHTRTCTEREGDFYGTLHTLETCVGMRGKRKLEPILTSTFLADWLREKWCAGQFGNRFFDTIPRENRSIFDDYSVIERPARFSYIFLRLRNLLFARKNSSDFVLKSYPN